MLAQDPTTTIYFYTGDAAAAAGIGIGIILIWLILVVAQLAFAIWAIIDVNKHSDAAWAAAGQQKQTWFILNIVGLFVCLLIPLYYTFGIRPKLKATGV